MLLETIRSLVARVAKYLPLDGEPLPISNLTKPSTTTNTSTSLPIGSASTNASKPQHPHTYQHPIEQAAPVANFFHNAHDMIINNPTISQIIYAGSLVFHLLAQKSLPGATLDSSARYYVPRCHPDTRKSLRYRITKWVADTNRHWKMLWVSGFAGVGKSAIAQTVAEEMQRLGRLGAVFFFSRSNGLGDPDRVIPTIAYQLAVLLPEYKRIITQRIADDPLILEKTMRFQFKALIVEPFQTLVAQNPRIIRDPLLVVVDGLDECDSMEAQCEFVELVNTHAQSDGCPLLWMICSRPEWHLKSVFSDADFHITCGREEVSIDDSEAQQDVARILRAEFEKIRRKYSNQLSSDWPPEAHLRRIAVAASGHLGFASFIVRFIGDQEYSDPSGQLDVCLKFLGGFGESISVNPLHALDLLFRQILSNVPTNILATTMRILGLMIFSPHREFCAQNQANFLSIDQALFYRSLRQLHSVLDVPSSSEAYIFPTRVYHASFSDFLRDPRRSRKFAINESRVWYDVAVQSLYWQNCANSSQLDVKWTYTYQDHDNALIALRRISEDLGWRACCRVSSDDIAGVIDELEQFDFSGMEYVPHGFTDFLLWLCSLGNHNGSLISYTEIPSTEIDQIPVLTLTYDTNDPDSHVSSTHPGANVRVVPPQGRAFKLRLGKNKPVLMSLTVNKSNGVLAAADKRRKRERLYPCPECANSFTTKQNLQNHLNSHSGINPYKCTYPGCNKEYRHSRSRNRHMVRAHRQ